MKYSELLRILKKAGWEVVRSKKHLTMRHKDSREQLTVPNHGSAEVKKGLLRAILKKANIKTSKR
jgi:predicted RNA binding protein YcfA (HicA-like mRNA interferase family)